MKLDVHHDTRQTLCAFKTNMTVYVQLSLNRLRQEAYSKRSSVYIISQQILINRHHALFHYIIKLRNNIE